MKGFTDSRLQCLISLNNPKTEDNVRSSDALSNTAGENTTINEQGDKPGQTLDTNDYLKRFGLNSKQIIYQTVEDSLGKEIV